jgi:hypothetical protein
MDRVHAQPDPNWQKYWDKDDERRQRVQKHPHQEKEEVNPNEDNPIGRPGLGNERGGIPADLLICDDPGKQG